MTMNVGLVDRVVRALVGIVLIAFALSIGFPSTGWNWIGWIGVIPLITAIAGICPLYSVLGLSTCPTAH
jgi:Inner membrane protein YgaP-like, transmembrane domain